MEVLSVFTQFIFYHKDILLKSFDLHKILFVISILSYPIVDIVRVVIIRIINKKSPFEADKNHIHHLILEKQRVI